MGKGMVGCQCGTQDLGPQLMVNHWMINIMHGREYITVVLTGKTGTGMHPVSKIGHMEIQWENSRNMIFPWEKNRGDDCVSRARLFLGFRNDHNCHIASAWSYLRQHVHG